MQRLRHIQSPQINDIIAHNTLMKSGMHTHYNFYKVTSITNKGNIVGYQLQRYLKEHLPNGRIVSVRESFGKKRRLKKVYYEKVIDVNSVFEEDCGYD